MWSNTSLCCWAGRYIIYLVGAAYYGELFLDETLIMKKLIGKRLITKNLGNSLMIIFKYSKIIQCLPFQMSTMRRVYTSCGN